MKNFFFKQLFLIFFSVLLLNRISFSQDNPNQFVKWSTWTLIQAVPSPVFYQDADDNNSRLQFGFRWNIVPVNYSFNANKLVSPVQFFFVNPVRRNGGSIELFAQPEWMTASFKYSDLNRFNFAAGVRGYIPLIEFGEYLCMSAGGKYNFTTNKENQNTGYPSIEAGLYTFFGIAGIVFNYNFNSQSRYNIGLNLKYY